MGAKSRYTKLLGKAMMTDLSGAELAELDRLSAYIALLKDPAYSPEEKREMEKRMDAEIAAP